MKQETFRLDNGKINIGNDLVFKQLFLQFFSGEVTGIITDTAFEKAVLVKFFSGDAPLTYGKIYLDESCVPISNLRKVLQDKIYVSQIETRQGLTLKVYEFIFFSQFNPLVIDKRKFQNKTAEIFHQFGLSININMQINRLSLVDFFYVDLIKAYINGKTLVILPDVSKWFTKEDFSKLKFLVSHLCLNKMSFVFIESFYNKILDSTSRIYFIENGTIVSLLDPKNPNLGNILSALKSHYCSKDEENTSNTPALTEDIFSLNHIYTQHLSNFDLHMHPGEVTCLLYQEDLFVKSFMEIFSSKSPIIHGNVLLDGEYINLPPIQSAHKYRIGIIEENPSEKMIFQNLPLIDSVCTPLSSKVPFFWVKSKYKKSVISSLKEYIPKKYFRQIGRRVPMEIRHMAAFCKWLVFSPKLLICIKPFSYTDQHLNEITEKMIVRMAKNNISVLILTPILPASFSVPCKLLTVKNGQITT